MISYANTFACLFYALQGLTKLGQKRNGIKISTQIEMWKSWDGKSQGGVVLAQWNGCNAPES